MKKRTRALFLKVITFFQIFSLIFQPLSLLSLLILDPVVARAQSEVVLEEQVLAKPVVEANVQAEPAGAEGVEEIINSENLNDELIDIEEELEEESEEESEETPPVVNEEGPGEGDATDEADLELSIPEPTLTLMPTPMPTVATAEEAIESNENSSLMLGDFLLGLNAEGEGEGEGEYTISGTSGKWTSTSNNNIVNNINTPYISWPTGYGDKSGLRFTGVSSFNFDEGETFNLGKLEHLNHPVSSAITQATLSVDINISNPNIGIKTFDFEMLINETNNVAGTCPPWHTTGHPPCDDKITFPTSYSKQTFDMGGKKYTLEITGFINAAGNKVNEFITEESKTNEATLVGKLTSVDSQVEICHRTNSSTNPYEKITVDANATVGGHNGHNGNAWYPGITGTWGDIIPRFLYFDGSGDVKEYAGKNNTDYGLSLLENDCKLPSGEIEVKKVTVPSGNNTSFDVTGTGEASITSPVTFIDGNTGTISATESKTFKVYPGKYSFTENPPSGWIQTGNNCNNIEIANNDKKSCTITNTQASSITIKKHAEPASNTGFSFTTTGAGLTNFTLTDTEVDTDPEKKFSNLLPGKYSIVENLPNGWHQAGATCDNGQKPNELDISAGSNVTCTFTNTQYGKLIFKKHANPASEQEFSFNITGNGVEDFKLTDDSTTEDSIKEFSNLLPGEYSIVENLPTGWYQEGVSCTSSLGHTEVITGLNLDMGETITCTFTNTKYGKISGYKLNDADNSNTTTDDRTPVSGWTIFIDKDGDGKLSSGDISTTTNAVGYYEFTNLLPDSYKVYEALEVGWIVLVIDNHTVELPAGGNIENVNFVNVKQGSISGTKWNDVNGNGVKDEGEEAVEGVQICIDVNTDNVCDADEDSVTTDEFGNYTFSNLLPGTYTIIETLDSGWEQTYPEGKHVVQLSAGDIKTGYNFGNWELKSGMTVEKSSTTTLLLSPQTVTYSYLVTNTGNTTLTGITLSDNNDNDDMNCPKTTLQVNENMTCTATHTFTQEELDTIDTLDNTVTADSDQTDSVTDDLSIPITQSPDMSVTKDADLESVNAAGQLITYTIKVFNDGNTTLKNVSVEDQLLSNLDCDGTAGEPYTTSGLTINVGSNLTCTGTYTVTQDDIDSKAKILNTVTAKNTVTDPETDDEEVDVVKNPELSIVKSGSWVDADEDGYADVGETISYTFTVKNEGNVTLTDITVEDLLPNLSAVSCPATTLAVGKDMTCTASYEITQADIDAGKVKNIATADSEESEEETDDEEVDLPQDPKLSIVKSGTFEDEDGDGFADVGETISYIFTVKNEGNVTLTNVTVTDLLVTVSGGPITLNVGETDSTTFTASYTITQEDIDMGSFYNIATADSDESDPDTGDTTVELPQNPKLSIFKTGVFEDGDDEITNPGDLITYSFLVTNTGNITLTGITVTDPLSGLSAISCPASTLAVGGSTTCTATYAITQADIDVGKVDNTATADSTEKASDEDDATVELPQNPALDIVKTATPSTYDKVGDVIDYSFEVTNTGNVTLIGPFTVSDDKATDESCPDTASLAPGATITCTASYEITLDDLDAESVTNVAFAEGYFGETPVESPEDTETVTSTAGKITVYKYYDINRDGVKSWDEATLADWEMIMSSDEEEDSIKQSTAESGSTLFYLPAGDWQLSETMQEDWEQTGIYCEYAEEGKLISLPGEGYGCHGNCYGWNNCGDAATCALWACNINGYANLVSYGKDYPCTQLNTCHLFYGGPGSIEWNWNNWCDVFGVTNIYCSNGNGVAQRIAGYNSNGDVYQNNAYNLTVNPGDKRVCYVGNSLNSQLMIEKTNDAWPNDQAVGNEVTYTIKLMAIDGPVYDVSLSDLPPNAFSYVAGSYTANSSIIGDLSLAEPNYASPGEWQLGDLAKDEIITVSYKAIIGDEADAGIYPDVAWATGTSAEARHFEEEADLLALSDPDFHASNGGIDFLGDQGHYGEDHFVGTRVAVVTDETPSAKYKVEKIKEKEGEVLGASLPATGANFWLSLLAILSILTGTGLLLVPNRKRRQGKVLMMLLMLGLGLLMAKPVQAITSVRLAQPYNNSAELDQDAITNQDKFRIDFVVLNTEGLSLNAQCQQQEDGGAWTNIDTFYTVKAGGNSGYCEAKDLANNSQYAFRVSTSDRVESSSVKVALDTDRPKTPVSYEKNRINSCKYEIKFKTADDGRTSKVEVYRSDDNVSFTVKASNRIKTIAIGPDEEYSFETTRPDCDKDYYYAIRAFDQYGNASDLVGDREVKTVIVEGTTGETEETTGALAVTEIVILDGEIGADEAGVLSEGLLGEELTEDEKGKILGIETESLLSFLTKVLLPILVFVTISVLVYRLVIAKRNEK